MLTIKILGPGCANCKQLEKLVRKILEETSIEAEVTKVTDYNTILAFNVFTTPALVINDKAVCSGRIPSSSEISAFIKAAL